MIERDDDSKKSHLALAGHKDQWDEMTKRAKAPSKSKARTSRVKTSRARPKRSATVAARLSGGDALDALIDASAQALALPLDPAWKGAIRTNLEVNLRLAGAFADFPLPDDAEPAPVFTA
jgi:hypothetical protein